MGAIDPIAIHLGPLAVRWYGVIFVLATTAALWVSVREAAHLKLDPDFLLDAAVWIVPAGIIGARLYEVFVLSWGYYRTHLMEIPAIWHGGLAIHGGVIGGLIAGAVMVRRRRQSFWQWADVVAPGLILAQAIGRWGNFFNQEAYGAPAPDWIMRMLPAFIRNQMWIDGAYMHPTFLYESLWNLLCFGLLLIWRRRNPARGAIFFGYVVLYDIGRLVIESIRMDSSFVFGGYRVAQIAAAVLIGAGVAGVLWRRRLGARYADQAAQLAMGMGGGL